MTVSIHHVKDHLLECTKDQLSAREANNRASDFDKLIKSCIAFLHSQTEIDLQELDEGTKALLSGYKGLELVSMYAFGDSTGTGSMSEWERFEPEWKFVTHEGKVIELQADIKDLEFDGAEMQGWVLTVDGEPASDLIIEGNGEDALDAYCCSEFSTSMGYDRDRKTLNAEEVDQVAELLGMHLPN